jgi:hypothetical protein
MVTDSYYLQSPVLGISDIRNVFHRKTKSSANNDLQNIHTKLKIE